MLLQTDAVSWGGGPLRTSRPSRKSCYVSNKAISPKPSASNSITGRQRQPTIRSYIKRQWREDFTTSFDINEVAAKRLYLLGQSSLLARVRKMARIGLYATQYLGNGSLGIQCLVRTTDSLRRVSI